MLDKLAELVNANPALVRRGRWTCCDMLIGIGEDEYLVRIREGRIVDVRPAGTPMAGWDFAIRGTAEAWVEFWKPMPKPRHHDIIALMREGKMRIEGDLDLMMANLLYLKLVLEAPRALARAS